MSLNRLRIQECQIWAEDMLVETTTTDVAGQGGRLSTGTFKMEDH
jgi:hypothetical protein